MEGRVTVAVEVPMVGDPRRKNWAKVVEAVDTAKSSGWAYDGPFVATGGIQDLPVGSLLLVYGEKGARANPQILTRLYMVNSDGTLSHVAEAKGRAWARTLRDHVERYLGEEPAKPDLSHLSDEDLAGELRSRGWIVDRG